MGKTGTQISVTLDFEVLQELTQKIPEWGKRSEFISSVVKKELMKKRVIGPETEKVQTAFLVHKEQFQKIEEEYKRAFDEAIELDRYSLISEASALYRKRQINPAKIREEDFIRFRKFLLLLGVDFKELLALIADFIEKQELRRI